MLTCGVSDIQTKPAIFKQNDILEIEDKRKNISLGFFISSKYSDMLKPILKEIEQKERVAKLKKLKQHQDLEFLEVGVDDGL